MMKKRSAFTLLEMVFVIISMGFLAKFGVEFLVQAYRSYIYTHENSKLSNLSSIAVKFIAIRLQYRIKDSVIIRNANNFSDFKTLEGETETSGYNVLEWIGYDRIGFMGNTTNNTLAWSGILDKEYSHQIAPPSDLYSPKTNTTAINDFIQTLSGNTLNINGSAIYIMSSESDVENDYGWDGSSISDQNHTIHPIKSDTNISKFVSANTDDFKVLNMNLDDARYKLVWSAYAIVYTPGSNYDGNLTLYYNYQPWNGEKYSDGNSAILMKHVSAFRKSQSFGAIKIQVCIRSDLIKDSDTDEKYYSVCKERIIY